LPFLPAAWHGREVAVIAVLYVGDMAEGERQLAALPALESRSRMSSGRRRSQDSRPRNYWKSHDLRALTDATIDGIVHFVGRLPSLHCEIFVAHLGGAVARVAPDATAFGRRDTEFVLNVHIRWEHASDDAHCIGWGREFFTAMAPHAMGSVYVNIMSEDETDRVQAAFDRNFARLATVRRSTIRRTSSE
jgi:Berberine and berberine like